VLGIVFTLLVAAFGWGVWMSADGRRSLRIAGGLIVIYGLVGVFWPPMHRREMLAAGGGTLTDTLHIVFTFSLFLIMAAIAYSSAPFGRRFRIYSIATLVVMFGFGILTGLESPGLHTGQPTPWIGLWERTSAAAFVLWIFALGIALRREQDARPKAVSGPKGLLVHSLQGR
jgi:hypothetical protein